MDGIIYRTPLIPHDPEAVKDLEGEHTFSLVVRETTNGKYFISQRDYQDQDYWNTTPMFMVNTIEEVFDKLFDYSSGIASPTYGMSNPQGMLLIHRILFIGAYRDSSWGDVLEKVLDISFKCAVTKEASSLDSLDKIKKGYVLLKNDFHTEWV